MQVATHVISGLADAVGAVQRRSQQLFAPANGLRNPAMAAKAATSTAAEGIGKLLEAINVASSIIKVQGNHGLLVILAPTKCVPAAALCGRGHNLQAVPCHAMGDVWSASVTPVTVGHKGDDPVVALQPRSKRRRALAPTGAVSALWR